MMLILQCHLDINYVFNMSLSELNMFAKYSYLTEKTSWETARFMGFCCLSPYSKDLEIKDLIEFPWETATQDNDKNDLERIKQLAKTIEDKSKKAEHKLD